MRFWKCHQTFRGWITFLWATSKLVKLTSGWAREHCLRRELENAKSRIVHLSSGASLVIEVTEALSVIDVNTACSAQKRKHMNREENFLSTNLEAARECARQIRLRNLSGIILIDFINMEKKESTEQLIHALKQYLLKDPVRTRFEDITKLGLVEITRMKIEKPL